MINAFNLNPQGIMKMFDIFSLVVLATDFTIKMYKNQLTLNELLKFSLIIILA